MQKDDHLISARIGYSHHGIYIGRNKVIHYSGSSLGKNEKGVIEIVDLETFCQGNGYTTQTYPFRTFSRDETVELAKSRLGEEWYSVILNNCEHFATWCIQGFHHSHQVSRLIDAATLSVVPVCVIAAKLAGRDQHSF
ncbi:lecithin retinol acyltransferase family protein [Chitinibacter fontanus]|uniref:Lecithin retinol acyltransferase family protein n=1 Tax=Chitinibacter fontanus TaxID=1737446 RepID=A0A7D5V7M3_9NEIS|nr:lecithin retinol acyltransferase family protein [Chitinibacter fontanus]QLI80271.1 lecithin retinol acyltransferase family protein [Chitinibacter fontanus]